MRLAFLSVLPLVLLGLFACKPSAPPMQVGITKQSCDSALYLASTMQFWSPDNARIQIYPSNAHAYTAFKEGSIDAVSLYPHEVLRLWSENIPATIVLVLEVSNGADTLIAHPSVATLRDLQGKTVAIDTSPNNLYLLERALDSVALDRSVVNTVPFNLHAHASAFAKSNVHAISAKRQHLEELINTGGNELFSSRNIPGEIVQVLAINPHYLHTYPNRVNTLINNWFNVIRYIDNNPTPATEQIASWLNVEPEQIYKELSKKQLANQDDNIRMLVGDGASLHITLHKLRTVMLEHNLLPRPPPLDHIINDSFVR